MRWQAVCFFALAMSFLSTAAPAQEHAGSLGGEALLVLLDCAACDRDHFRREVTFVSYVRDREDAEVHVLVTWQPTGGGGRSYTFELIGLGRFAGRRETLSYVSRPDSTEYETREGMVRTFVLGLMPFVAGSPLAERITVTYEAARKTDLRPQAVRDPWNLWVFGIGGGGTVNARSKHSLYSVNGSLSAERTTRDWRIKLSTRGEKSSAKSDEDITAGLGLARGLGQHWALGGHISALRSRKDNQDLTLRAGPELEYSILPYTESGRRKLALFTTIAVARFDYKEITIFERQVETRVQQTFGMSAGITRPWGVISGEAKASVFLDNFTQYSTGVSGQLNIRIAKGLSIRVTGLAKYMKDQIYRPRRAEEIILLEQQLGRDFNIALDIGFNYTFGSIVSSVVGRRMTSMF